MLYIALIVSALVLVGLGFYVTHQQKKISFQKGFQRGKSEGWFECSEDRIKMHKYTLEQKQKNFLFPGSIIICVSNEWQDLSVGPIIGFMEVAGKTEPQCPVIQDVISGEESGGGIFVPYTPEMLHALIKLDPFERWSVLVASQAISAQTYIFDKKKSYSDEEPAKVRPYEELYTLLKEKGLL